MKEKRLAAVPENELSRQQEYIKLIKEKNGYREQPPAAFVDTYGCQQNEADSELLRGMLDKMGYVFTKDDFKADLVLINTCAVREHAEMRVFGNVGALVHSKKANPSQIIAVCGCMAQEKGVADRIKKSFRHVDLVFGTHAIWRFPELIFKTLSENKRVFCVTEEDGRIAEGLPAYRENSIRAWLSIMYGCNNFCSYCIVPYVRGRERSRTLENILREARLLVSDGVKDLTLLGQNVNSYGRDLEEETDFAGVIERINAIEGDFLIRFMTSHPKDATQRLFDTMAKCGKCARHIHLPFQSGSDRVLKAMNRGYTAEGYLKLIEYARQVMPEIVITSDVIVGFPGETDAEFEDTLNLVSKAQFDALFTFIYSKRPGTPAENLPDPTGREEKQARFDRLIKLQNGISQEKHAAYVGKTLRVLVDGEGRNESFPLSARTNGNRLVHLRGGKELIGTFQDAKIIDSSGIALFGELAD